MSDTLKIGSIIKEPQQRDAVHMAIAPIVAARVLLPGFHVGIDKDGLANTVGVKTIGVVDPFLRGISVGAGETFWLFLYPGEATALRHEWTHPALPVVNLGAKIEELEQRVEILRKELDLAEDASTSDSFCGRNSC